MRAWVGVAILGLVMAFSTTAAAQTVGLLTIKGAIGPATTAYVERGIADAHAAGNVAVILEIDTPGGLVTSTREIVTAILNAPIPVIGYVAPEGAQAASAGTYIMMATHVAAMAPATNMGAATPVQMGGSSPLPIAPDEEAEEDEERPAPTGEAGEAKAIADAAAWMRALAEKRGRNKDWAERAVREADSISASEALELGVIEIVAASRRALLQEADGLTVQLAGDREVTLAVADADVVAIERNWQEELLGVLANPNIAFILMLVGIYGIIFEFANPGTIFSGVIGAIALLLGLFSLNLLPIDYAGAALIGFGIVLMIAEAFAPSFGILGIGGAIAFVLGSIMLIDTEVPGFTLSPWVIGAATVTTLGLMSGVLAMALKAYRRRTVTGADALIGEVGRVVRWTGERGLVHVAGENWQSHGPAGLAAGQTIVVTKVDGLILTVDAQQQREA
ncbi:MAG: nodulation protein NfeD [Geminicoccaceae bacterium]|nr:MAG: nodulation protein NfeD [Geminicoccaceae bacterium]